MIAPIWIGLLSSVMPAERHHVLLGPAAKGDEIVQRHGVHKDAGDHAVDGGEGFVLHTFERSAIEDDAMCRELFDVGVFGALQQRGDRNDAFIRAARPHGGRIEEGEEDAL